MNNKKIMVFLSVFGGFLVIASTVFLIFQHQQNVRKEIDSSLSRSIDINEEYRKETAAAAAVVEQAALYTNHQGDSNFANEVSVPMDITFDSEEMAFVSDLNYILKTKDVHSFVRLFKQEEFQAWLTDQKIQNEPEKYILSYMEECMGNIVAFHHYQRAGEHYLKITFKDGQEKNTELAIVPEQDYLRFSLSFEEFKEYMS